MTPRQIIVLAIMAADLTTSIAAAAYLKRAVLPVRVAFTAGRTAERIQAAGIHRAAGLLAKLDRLTAPRKPRHALRGQR